MDPGTKDYIDSRDGAVESRAWASSQDNKAHLEAMEKWFAASQAEFIRVNRSIERRMDNIEREMTSVKRTVVISCITATLSTVFGVAAFNAALLSNMQSAFESGRLVSAVQADIQRQVRETDSALETLRARVEDTNKAVISMQRQIENLNGQIAPQPQKK